MAVTDILRGRTPRPPVPPEAYEFIMLRNFGAISLHQIRNMSYRDFHIFSTLSEISVKIDINNNRQSQL